MARIAGVNIPSQKKLGVALTYVYGVGKKVSIDVCEKANVDSNTRVNDLSESEIKNISDDLFNKVYNLSAVKSPEIINIENKYFWVYL